MCWSRENLRSDTLIRLKMVKDDLLNFMLNFEGCQPVSCYVCNYLCDYLCRVSGELIQFVCNLHEGKGGKVARSPSGNKQLALKNAGKFCQTNNPSKLAEVQIFHSRSVNVFINHVNI